MPKGTYPVRNKISNGTYPVRNKISNGTYLVREVSEYLRIHPYTVRRLAREEKIPAFKAGGQWRFDAEEIEGWRKTRPPKTI